MERGRVTSTDRVTYQAIALLARRERVRVRTDESVASRRDAELKRLDGIAAILARIAATDPSFFELLDEDAEVTSGSRAIMREMQRKAGLEPDPEKTAEPEPGAAPPERRVAPKSAVAAQLANPFMAPDFSAAPPRPTTRRLAGWELIEPLLNSFEHANPGAPACMELPDPTTVRVPGDLELMPHQAQVVAVDR